MTLSTLATIYGCCGLFDLCSDQDLLSLSFEGSNQFIDWIGWEKTNVCVIKKNFITWTRPEENAQHTRSVGYLSNPCGDSNGVDWGGCDFTLEDFALLRRHGPERNATRASMKLCEAQPRYRLDGTPITNDVEFDMRLAGEGLIQDLKLMLIDGNATTTGQFDGLERLVKTGYTNSKGYHCHSMDSIVIDWNSNDYAGGNGITWNGAAVGNTYSFIDVLMAVVRNIKKRISLAPALAAQALREGDMIFVAPSHILNALLDSFTCWSVCPGQTNIQVAIQSYEARRFREGLMGGMFGAGTITIDGFKIPLCPYDWNLYNTSTGESDAYLLTGQIGNVKLISGQYLDLSTTPTNYPEAMYSYTDGGKFLTWLERTKTCVYRETEIQPRLLAWAPWAQARFEDIDIESIGPVIGPDPWASTFPETSFSSAVCP
jgi:hypothetical protein